MDTRYASRKFMVTLLVLAIGTSIDWFGTLTPQLLELLKWTLGLYCGFNVSQKAAEWVATAIQGIQIKAAQAANKDV